MTQNYQTNVTLVNMFLSIISMVCIIDWGIKRIISAKIKYLLAGVVAGFAADFLTSNGFNFLAPAKKQYDFANHPRPRVRISHGPAPIGRLGERYRRDPKPADANRAKGAPHAADGMHSSAA